MKVYQRHGQAVWESIFHNSPAEWLSAPPSEMMRSCAGFLRQYRPRHIIDVGSGFGRWSIYLSQQLGAHVIGVEYTLGGNLLARRLLPLEARVHFVTGEASNLPMAAATADAAIVVLLLENLARPEAFAAAANIARVCKPSSPALIVLNPLETTAHSAEDNPTATCHIERYTENDLRSFLPSWTVIRAFVGEYGFRIYEAETPAPAA